MTLAFLKSERAIDYLRWGAAFVAVVLVYGAAGWRLLRPTGWERGVNLPAVEIDLPETQLAATPPTDRKNSSEEMKRDGTDAPGAPDVAAAPRTDAASGSNDGRPPEAADVAGQVAAKDKTDEPAVPGARTPDGPGSETLPRTDAADSGGAGRPTVAPPPRVVTPDNSTNSTSASIMRAPIDASIAPGPRSLLRIAKGRLLLAPLPALPFKPAPPLLATPAGHNDLFSRKSNPVAGLTLAIPVPATSAVNHGNAQDLASKPAINANGNLARNAIGIVIGHRAVAPQGGAPLGIHPLPGAAALLASGPATSAVGAPLAAMTPRPGDAGASPGAANRGLASHPYQASVANHVASAGGPAVGGAPMIRPASSMAAVGGSAKTMVGGISGTNVRMRHP
jgi:hypothetical protein